MKKKKKPTFNVLGPSRGHAMKKRIKDRWRRPRGVGNKKRIRKKWAGALPNIGYKNPDSLRGRHPSGYFEVLVYRVEDLEKVDPEKQAIRIAARVGKKKRLEIVAKAKELNIHVLNPGKGGEKE
ncbi:MAG: 50S ribosomal protein L32e [Candidatus Micrarchaeota archaeon]|nr:50S ribosomal protein L32e [Candidatus Micrarchaeota archaeon]